jgi:hypothetical protein
MDPQHPLGRVVSNNEERENDGSSGCMVDELCMMDNGCTYV